jgi:hypothetical protein
MIMIIAGTEYHSVVSVVTRLSAGVLISRHRAAIRLTSRPSTTILLLCLPSTNVSSVSYHRTELVLCSRLLSVQQ